MIELAKNRKIQIVIATVLTFCILLIHPAYSWLRMQRALQRYEKISSPNSLYISAARREDQINFKVDAVDVKAFWKDSDGENVERATYQDYVFSVAGDYVTSYTLQLAHTTNNNYTYEIFKADVTDADPSQGNSTKIKGRDYIEYTLTERYDPEVLSEISDNPVYANVGAGDKLYYSVKLADDNTTKVSLNATNPTEANAAEVVKSSYTVDDEIVQYNGHYLNWNTFFTAESSGKYHVASYGSYNTVNTHAEPLYWQATKIPGGYPENKYPFYHEYILRVSWTTDDIHQASSTYKDTDLIYITVKTK
ncbi:MAG: hypothetical protein IKN54_07410 [Lachnospiraceae bacterium]|nr:hypothetical protein [Lachnospiraceae bacterium]